MQPRRRKKDKINAILFYAILFFLLALYLKLYNVCNRKLYYNFNSLSTFSQSPNTFLLLAMVESFQRLATCHSHKHMFYSIIPFQESHDFFRTNFKYHINRIIYIYSGQQIWQHEDRDRAGKKKTRWKDNRGWDINGGIYNSHSSFTRTEFPDALDNLAYSMIFPLLFRHPPLPLSPLFRT